VVDSWAWIDNFNHGLSTQVVQVPCFHIQSVLDAYDVTDVDFLSVDAEGADIHILKAIDWSRFSAEIVSVEAHENALLEQELKYMFLEQLGYARVKKMQWDLLFFKL
jgi:hypothetical protein